MKEIARIALGFTLSFFGFAGIIYLVLIFPEMMFFSPCWAQPTGVCIRESTAKVNLIINQTDGFGGCYGIKIDSDELHCFSEVNSISLNDICTLREEFSPLYKKYSMKCENGGYAK